MITPPVHVIAAAVQAATHSPCQKSKRGAAIFEPWSGRVIGIGNNHLPIDHCTGSDRCRATCGRRCIYAEEVAVRAALHCRRVIEFSLVAAPVELVHAKVVDGQLVGSGGPSCWQCSKLLVEVQVAGIWLYQRRDPTCPGERCPFCTGERCAQCVNTGPGWAHCDHDGMERHVGAVPDPPARWRRYDVLEFHRLTAIASQLTV